jgi:cystathionine gamma-synthase
LAEQLRFHQNAIGGVASPFDCWLILRGLRTLAVRMEKHCDNAELVAAFLDDHPRIAQVYFPGLDAHPGHDLAKRQMRRYGGMVSFRVVGGEQAALQVCEGTSVIILGESLGGVESLIEHPGKMTHLSVAGTQLEVPSDLIRLSVGIEDAEDLIADLDRALA